jgi:hypothetical protein
MAGHQRRANSGNDNNNNQEHDHREAILEGLGEQLRQIQECLERLEVAGREPHCQEGAAHEGVHRHGHRRFQNNSSSEDEDGINPFANPHDNSSDEEDIHSQISVGNHRNNFHLHVDLPEFEGKLILMDLLIG